MKILINDEINRVVGGDANKCECFSNEKDPALTLTDDIKTEDGKIYPLESPLCGQICCGDPSAPEKFANGVSWRFNSGDIISCPSAQKPEL